ncbi:recombination regulator RecX [Streptosporangium sp. NBC_01755]|nr:recombination regulator RecX [Streptosporangium sp. NBC_01755]WSA29682.1 recombination regulator RecX [Streptosporangium sp. NBC_01810]WSD04176.1 recombination regulator RecX [Streptosporangium sp. NBC_01755]
MGADLGPAGELGPRDWGAWPDEPRTDSPGRSGRGRGDGAPAPEGGLQGEGAGSVGGEPRSRKGRGSRRGERRSGGDSPGAFPEGLLPDGPAEGSPASRGAGADPQAVARAICLRLLTMAPRTRAQLAEALRKREVPQEAADAVLERFSEVGLIDDEAFAAAWVSSRHAGRGLARKALASELRHRGVDEETVKDAVEQLDPEQEAETARRLVRRKLSSTRGLDPAVRTRRLAGLLARKGYGPGLAFRVIREVLEDDEVETTSFLEDSGYPLD